jgi:Flp pilus assembly protein TadD
MALSMAGELRESLVHTRKAVELLRDRDELPSALKAGYFVNLSISLRNCGRFGDGIAMAEEAIACDPSVWQGHNARAKALAAVGRDTEAEAAYGEVIRLAHGRPRIHASLARLQMKRGAYELALENFRQAIRLGSKEPMVIRQFRQAQHMLALAKKLAAVETGTAEPASLGESLALAQVAQTMRHHVSAARLRAEVFEAEPALAEDLRHHHRYNGACAAALAGAGEGEDAGDLDDAGRARWRKQAVSWLRANLILWEKLAPANPALVVQTLHHWTRDTDLAGIRDEAEVAKLPPEEQEACRSLWRDVVALRKRLGGRR